MHKHCQKKTLAAALRAAAYIAWQRAIFATAAAKRAEAAPAAATARMVAISAVANAAFIPGRRKQPPGGYGQIRRRQRSHHQARCKKVREGALRAAKGAVAQTNQFMQALWFVADATLKEVAPKVKAKQERSRRMGEEVAAAIDAQLGISRPGADVSSKVDGC